MYERRGLQAFLCTLHSFWVSFFLGGGEKKWRGNPTDTKLKVREENSGGKKGATGK